MNSFLKVILILLNTHSIPSTILDAAGHQQLLECNINCAECILMLTVASGSKKIFLFNDALNTFYLWSYGIRYGYGLLI